MVVTLRCQKCRYELIRESSCNLVVVNAHGETSNSKPDEIPCSSVDENPLWFLNESPTPWISDLITQAEWTKGKINCPKCDARVGSFDFVSNIKCACGASHLPAVHLVKSKVDCTVQGCNLLDSLKQ